MADDKKVYYMPCAELAENNKRLSTLVDQFARNMKDLQKCKKELERLVKIRSERHEVE